PAGFFRWPVVREAPALLRVGPPQRLLELTANSGCYTACRLAGGTQMAVADRGQGRIVICDLEKPANKLFLRGNANLAWMSASPDGRFVAASTWGVDPCMVRVSDVEAARVVWQWSAGSGLTRTAFSPNGAWLVTSGQECRIWDVGSWQLAKTI